MHCIFLVIIQTICDVHPHEDILSSAVFVTFLSAVLTKADLTGAHKMGGTSKTLCSCVCGILTIT